jgi:hypothetical protein
VTASELPIQTIVRDAPADAWAFKSSRKLTLQEHVMKSFNGFSSVMIASSDATPVATIRRALCAILVAAMLASFALAEDHQSAKNNPPASVKLTGQQFNTLISQEATQNLVTYLANQSGGGPLSGTWSGTVTDQGWSLTFSGSINSQAAALAESGSLKGSVASWSDSGTVGSNNVSGSGTATLMSSNKVKWAQKVGEGNVPVPEDLIDVIQQLFCDEGYPCDVVHFISDLLRGIAAIDTTELDLKTGAVFASSVPTTTQGVTTVQQGAIALDTGAISYDSDTFTPEGAGGLH